MDAIILKRVSRVSIIYKQRDMTKKAMIQAIQQTEAAMFLELKKTEQVCGTDNSLTTQLRTRWAVMDELMKTLGIELDITLPDNIEATNIICERVAAGIV
jgi:hypothetical protein